MADDFALWERELEDVSQPQHIHVFLRDRRCRCGAEREE